MPSRARSIETRIALPQRIRGADTRVAPNGIVCESCDVPLNGKQIAPKSLGSKAPKSEIVARTFFAITGIIGVFAVGWDFFLAVTGDPANYGATTPLGSVINLLSYFTIETNTMVAVTCLLLAVRLNRPSVLFQVIRLTGLVSLILTAVVYHLLLAAIAQLTPAQSVVTQLLHTVVPILAVVGWLVFGPRGATSFRVVAWIGFYPLIWGLYTFARGALTGWYPYPFIDVPTIGYPAALINVAIDAVALYAMALLLHLIDVLLTRLIRRWQTRG